MALFIVNNKDKAPVSALEAIVTLDGVVMINVGESPEAKLLKEVEKIAKKFSNGITPIHFS